MRFRCRAGFTLVELLVAGVLINVGLLALVAGSSVVVRRQAVVRARAASARAAANRLELLAAGGCAAVSGGVTQNDGSTETWRAEPRANGTIELQDSIRFLAAGVWVAAVVETRVAC